uniref:Cytochrome b n=2 Tax=Ciona TaxID=7718 RepID=Q8HIN5_CIOIN|nr:cytochrome b [Ciona robusta]CAD56916.1 cytochrome b [Ciona robusta]SBU37553.1 cytochrome b [Ciona robusta]
MLRKNPLINLFIGSFYRLPAPINISYLWNGGSLIGMFMVVQILTGLFLSMHYCGNVLMAFSSVNHIMRDVNGGWMMRYMHANGASFFLAFIFMHIGRNLYYKTYYRKGAWLVGIVLLILSMLTAFLGYVLPWGQMSFWGATVITNFVTAIPVWGEPIVNWLWGGFSVDNPTLNRFYTFHFLFPFLIIALSVVHLFFIHQTGSSNPLGNFSDNLKLDFWPYYGVKDILGMFLALFFFLLLVGFSPDLFGDAENFLKANSMVTPVHIKPEWYFLFAYAILRCIPNKKLGVLALVFSIVVFFFFIFSKKKLLPSLSYRFVFWIWAMNFIMLTWLGGCPVKDIFIFMAQISSFIYFFFLFLMMII